MSKDFAMIALAIPVAITTGLFAGNYIGFLTAMGMTLPMFPVLFYIIAK